MRRHTHSLIYVRVFIKADSNTIPFSFIPNLANYSYFISPPHHSFSSKQLHLYLHMTSTSKAGTVCCLLHCSTNKQQKRLGLLSLDPWEIEKQLQIPLGNLCGVIDGEIDWVLLQLLTRPCCVFLSKSAYI